MDIETCISKLRDKIYIDKRKLTDSNTENKMDNSLSIQDDVPVPSTNRSNISDICRDANDQTSEKLRKKKKEKLNPAATRTKELPLNELDKNVDYPLIDVREQEKERLRQVLLCGGEFGFGEIHTAPQTERRMVRYGEYSPRNPNLVPSDRPLLALGEYEERRRLLLEQKKREYMEQMNQARFDFKPSRKEILTDDEMSGDVPSIMKRTALSHLLKNETPSHQSITEGTQTEDGGDEFYQEVTSPFLENRRAKSQITDDMPAINAQYSPGSYHAVASNYLPVSPFKLSAPDDLLQSSKFPSLSPRERKLAELRGSENYSPSFFVIPDHRDGVMDSGMMHFYQPDDQQLKTRMRNQAYQEELRQQIEEKKRLEALQREKEKKEDEAIMRRVREQQERMRLEYEHEKTQRQIRQAERLHMAEAFQRRQKELQWEAQQIREEEMRRRRGGGDGQVKKSVQKEFNEEIILKQSVDDLPAKEPEKKRSINFSRLSYSHPVPAPQTKLSDVNSLYQPTKEITPNLDNNFPKTSATKEHHKRCTKQHKRKSAHLDLPIDPIAPSQQKPHIIRPELQNQNVPGEFLASMSHTRSHREPSEQLHNQEVPLSHVEAVSHSEQDKEIPLIPGSHRRSGDITSEARPSNILTQLGDFRRQMEINHRKMEEDLQRKFPQKSSSF